MSTKITVFLSANALTAINYSTNSYVSRVSQFSIPSRRTCLCCVLQKNRKTGKNGRSSAYSVTPDSKPFLLQSDHRVRALHQVESSVLLSSVDNVLQRRRHTNGPS